MYFFCNSQVWKKNLMFVDFSLKSLCIPDTDLDCWRQFKEYIVFENQIRDGDKRLN